MRSPKLVYLCNALDDATREARRIRTDSPAASNKVFGLARAIRAAGGHPLVLSLGRGRQDNSGLFEGARVCRVGGIPVVYCALWHRPVFTHVVSLASAGALLWRLAARGRVDSLLAFNRLVHYLLALIVARLWKVPSYLDLEDGYTVEGGGRGRRAKNAMVRWTYDRLCNAGAMVATSGLARQTAHPDPYVCHGVAEVGRRKPDWKATTWTVLFGGSLRRELGGELLLAALPILRRDYPREAASMRFAVTGKGPLADAFVRFALSEGADWVDFYGVLPDVRYRELLAACHVGLSLRLEAFELGATTFPSKLVEYATHGLVVLTTRSSDVPSVFGEKGAVYLVEETPAELAGALAAIAVRRSESVRIAQAGREAVRRCCAPAVVGPALRKLLEGGAVPNASAG